MRLPVPSRPSPRALAIGAVVVAVFSLGAGGAWWWSATQARRAAATYATALAAAQQAQGPQATAEARAAAAAALEAALGQHPSAPLAAQAAYELGNLRYAQREWARARAAWEVAAARAASPTLATLARVGIGYAWEAERNHARALEAYQSALGRLRPGDFQYEELLVAVARIHEVTGKKAEAIEAYRRLLKEAPRSRRADDVKSRLASLGAAP